MSKNMMIVIADYAHETLVGFDELCQICAVPPDFIHELIAFGVIRPAGDSPDEWLFNMAHLRRIKSAIRLRRDLDVNLAGIAVILDLLDEMDELRTLNALYERHFLGR